MILQHAMHLAVMKEGAYRDSTATSQKPIKLFVGLTLVILCILPTDDVVILASFFAQSRQCEPYAYPVGIVFCHIDVVTCNVLTAFIHALIGVICMLPVAEWARSRLWLAIHTIVWCRILVYIRIFIIAQASAAFSFT